jgi:glycosyltransferase involved in cell wall biosynthesis
MTLSILICVHSTDKKHDNLLLDALESLNNQTYKKFDVFIVFDECWINTNNIVKNLYNFTINRLFHNKKEGLSVAKNFGLSNISSEWIGYLDADDLYMPNKLLKQIEYINNNKVDFLGTQAYNKYQNNNNLFDSCFKLGTYETNDQIKNRLLQENILTHGSMLIRKSCLVELNGYNNIKGIEDWDLWNRAIKKGYIFHQIQERLYIYTIGTSVSR